MVKRMSEESKPEDVDAYIARCPRNAQPLLREIRAAIKDVAPDACETTSYFRMPAPSIQARTTTA